MYNLLLQAWNKLTNHLSFCYTVLFDKAECSVAWASIHYIGIMFFCLLILYVFRNIFDEEKIKEKLAKAKSQKFINAEQLETIWTPTTFLKENLDAELALKVGNYLKAKKNKSKDSKF